LERFGLNVENVVYHLLARKASLLVGEVVSCKLCKWVGDAI
jgi:hypothetical protein